jgi:hypothetical protein
MDVFLELLKTVTLDDAVFVDGECVIPTE